MGLKKSTPISKFEFESSCAVSNYSGNYGNDGNIIDIGVSVSGGIDNSDETDNINSSDE